MTQGGVRTIATPAAAKTTAPRSQHQARGQPLIRLSTNTSLACVRAGGVAATVPRHGPHRRVPTGKLRDLTSAFMMSDRKVLLVRKGLDDVWPGGDVPPTNSACACSMCLCVLFVCLCIHLCGYVLMFLCLCRCVCAEHVRRRPRGLHDPRHLPSRSHAGMV